jgi:putative pyruvate formate lyase activating enzyme
MSEPVPAYLALAADGTLEARAAEAVRRLEACDLCPRQCGVNRLAGEVGFCRTGRKALVASYGPHFGEEDPLVGRGGSGAIFFTHCNLGCLFCQNYEISHEGEGREADPEWIAAVMIGLQEMGCPNINFVTPTHVAPMILEALVLAVNAGLKTPLVYNSGGYDRVETLRLLDGVFDIYMPDFKFWNPAAGRRFCGVSDYPDRAREAVREMHRQVGDLTMDERGVAVRGLLVRHLVLPQNQAGTLDVARFLAREISPQTYLNVMGQYRPCGRAREFTELARALTGDELEKARKEALAAGLTRLDERRRLLFRFY